MFRCDPTNDTLCLIPPESLSVAHRETLRVAIDWLSTDPARVDSACVDGGSYIRFMYWNGHRDSTRIFAGRADKSVNGYNHIALTAGPVVVPSDTASTLRRVQGKRVVHIDLDFFDAAVKNEFYEGYEDTAKVSVRVTSRELANVLVHEGMHLIEIPAPPDPAEPGKPRYQKKYTHPDSMTMPTSLYPWRLANPGSRQCQP
jgi:hypothetical protein